MITFLLLLSCFSGFEPTPDATPAADADLAYYTCPMHASVQQPGPGQCPICGMTLIPVHKSELSAKTIQIDAESRVRYGITLEAASKRKMTTTLALPGVVGWNQDRLWEVSSRLSGWVSSVQGAPGTSIRSGQILYQLYSPELASTAADLIRLSLDPSAHERLEATKTRIRRWGITDADIDTMLQSKKVLETFPIRAQHSGIVLSRTLMEGASIAEGATLYRLGDPGALWVEGAVPETQLFQLHPGQSVQIFVDDQHPPLSATIARILPEVDPQTRTARIRLSLPQSDGLRPEQWVTLKVALQTVEQLAIPKEAVLYTGPRRLVFVDVGEGKLEQREVRLGTEAEGYVQVLDGVQEGERVVKSGNFLVSSESRLKSGTELEGHATGTTGPP